MRRRNCQSWKNCLKRKYPLLKSWRMNYCWS
jgi:hypothetical protein